MNQESPLTVSSFVPETEEGATEIGRELGNAYYAQAEISEFRGIPRPKTVMAGREDYTTSGRLLIKCGSSANGGAMRIAPIGIVTRNLDREDLRKVVAEAIRSSHV